MFTFLSKLKYVAYLYAVLFLYKGILGEYPTILFYHIRGALEWVSNYIPTFAILTVLVISASWFFLQKFRKL